MTRDDSPLSRSNVRRHAEQCNVTFDEAWVRLAANAGLDQPRWGETLPGLATDAINPADLDDDDVSQP